MKQHAATISRKRKVPWEVLISAITTSNSNIEKAATVHVLQPLYVQKRAYDPEKIFAQMLEEIRSLNGGIKTATWERDFAVPYKISEMIGFVLCRFSA